MIDSSSKDTSRIFVAAPSKDYELLDSGDGLKLERYGSVVLSRPDPQALWRPSRSDAWKTIDASFQKGSKEGAEGDEESSRGKWVSPRDSSGLAEKWNIEYGGLTLGIRLTPFKHTGLFPEQIVNWQWSADKIKARIASRAADPKGAHSTATALKPAVLNLFGYTGGATLACALAGAEVTHVDASRGAITWANENARSSGLEGAPIKWMLEDAQSFVSREVRRGKTYDAIIMDPPAFGRGAKGEIWKIEDDFLPFFEDCLKLLSKDPLFFIVNGYAAGYSSIAYENDLKELVKRYGGSIESGELAIRESGPEQRLLPAGIVSRWSA